MYSIIFFVIGLLGGGGLMYMYVYQRERKVKETMAQQAKQQLTLDRLQKELKEGRARFDTENGEFQRRKIRYEELQTESNLLKRDLQNVDVSFRKLQLDGQQRQARQEELDRQIKELGSRYLKENVTWIGKTLTTNNFGKKKQELLKVIERCRRIDFEVPKDEEKELVANLKTEFEKAVRAQIEREEQARIKAQIREEKRLEQEIEKELKQLERERQAIQAALEKALAEASDEHSEEVQRLKERLAEAEAKSQRAMSMAQQTKSGHVYVISNIGSFGDGVYKVGMTRRLEPSDRIRELSSASVPFPFDVHMMISCDDAPTLENTIHRELHRERLNRANPRKEFFRVNLDRIVDIVQKNHGEVDYLADPEALEYNQTLEMSDEDSEFIASVYGDAGEEDE